MLTVSPKHRIFLAIKPIDFRKGIDGIARLCKQQFAQDPMNGHYFIFHNRRKTDIKLLYYDSQGFCLLQKRLSSGKFSHWPEGPNPLVTLSSEQLQVLLNNGDPTTVKIAPAWKTISDTTDYPDA